MSTGQPDFEQFRSSSEIPSGSDQGDSTDPKLFDQVLDETLSVAGESPAINPEDLQSLIKVAGRHADCPLTLDPVLIEIVQAILDARFNTKPVAANLWNAMARRVAETLWEDQPSRERIQKFWLRLCGARR